MNRDVRRATENDAETLVTLNEEFNGVRMSTSDVISSFSESKEIIALAILDNEPVGFASAQYFRSFCYRDLQGEITEMYIQEPARRKGLATMLITFLEQELQLHGVTSIKIITGSSNNSAVKTYERSNYVKKDYIPLHKQFRSWEGSK
nr:GNAT family N-acetyltransferase [Paenibacillus taihuensis]